MKQRLLFEVALQEDVMMLGGLGPGTDLYCTFSCTITQYLQVSKSASILSALQPKHTAVEAAQYMKTQSLQSIRYVQLILHPPLLSSNSLPSSKDFTALILQTKKK